MKHLFDTPIESADDDDLGRLSFAKSLAAMIHEIPVEMSARFAVYGDWGEGKTSVMRLIARELKTREHAIAWFAPWTAESTDQAWHSLLVALSIASGADEDLTARIKYYGSLAGAGLAQRTKELTDLTEFTKPLGLLTAPFEKGGRALLRKGRNIAIADIRKALRERRLTIFVDDLDRVDPTLVPRLLMGFRETFDLPGFTFVLGLSPSLIEEGLRQAGYRAEGSAHRFLEKIVEYPHYLPPMTIDGGKKLVSRAMAENPRAVRRESIEAVQEVLPANPRRLKIFLRHLLSLGPLLSRFTDDEISWTQLYVSLLLRLEFPGETYQLIGDQGAITELSYRRLTREAGGSDARVPKSTNVEDRHAPRDGPQRQRFLALCEALAEHASFASGRYTLRQLLTLPDEPPHITWKELDEFVASIPLPDGATIEKATREAIGEAAAGTLSEARARALFEGVIDLRDAMLDHAIDANQVGVAADSLEKAAVATDIVSALAIRTRWFELGTLSFPNWVHLYKHCQKWSRYTADPDYASFRGKECDLLRDATAALSVEAKLDTAPILFGHVSREDEIGDGFKTLLDDLRTVVGDIIARHLVAAFEVAGGLEVYVDKDWNWRGRNFLFEPDSLFHQPSIRGLLQRAAAKASEDQTVSENFLLYFKMLIAAAFEGALRANPMEVRQLVNDDQLLGIVWSGVTARPLALRTIGGLIDNRKRIATNGGSRAAMPIPKSWMTYRTAFPDAKDFIAEMETT